MNQYRRRPKTPKQYLMVASFIFIMFLPWQHTVLALWMVAIALTVARWVYPRLNRPAPEPIPDGTRLGVDSKGEPVVLTDQQLSAHGLILGASGSGKTTSLLSILAGQIDRGRAVVAIDLKGSPNLIDGLANAADRAGVPFRLWTPDGPGHWNPLANGNPTELKDKLIGTESWSEPHYQRAAERYLQTTIQTIQAKHPEKPATLNEVVALLEPKRLAASLGKLPERTSLRVREYLTSLTPDQRSAVNGLASRLAVISESHTGPYLEPNGPSTIDLPRALANREVVLFSLNASTYGKLAAHLAALIIQDLTTTAGQRLNKPDKQLALLAIDEFSALDHGNILALLARAREAALSILLSTQELADLELTPGLRDQILGNVVLTLAHRQNVPASAEIIAKLTGTRTVWQHTWQTDTGGGLLAALAGQSQAGRDTGLGSKREVEEFRIHPNTIKELNTGQAVLITKLPRSTTTIVHVTPTNQHGHPAR